MSFSLTTDPAVDTHESLSSSPIGNQVDLEAGQGLLTPNGSPAESDFDPTPIIPESTPSWLIGSAYAPLSRLPPPPSLMAWIYLWINMAAPLGIMFFGLGVLSSAWWTMLLFHFIACLLLPIGYTFIFIEAGPRKIWWNDIWSRTFSSEDNNGKPSRGPHVTAFTFLTAAGTATLGFILYLAFRSWVPNVKTEVADYGLGTAFTGATYLWVAYFSFVNPFFEEFFWRAFLQSAWSRSWTLPVPVQSFWYSVYHMVPVWVFFNGWYALFVLFVLFFAGLIFSAQFQRYGGHANVAFHIGADLAIGVVLLNMIWGIV